MSNKTLILTDAQIKQKVNRIAYQIYENNYEEKELIIGGISERGFILANKIVDVLKTISPAKITLVQININRKNLDEAFSIPLTHEQIDNKPVIIVDDVLNSGRTLIYGVKHFLEFPLKKLSTAVLVDRNHKNFPVRADYVGISLSTTMQEHISVEFNKEGKDSAYLL